MDDAIFSSNGDSLEEIVLLHLGLRHLTLSVAESCTGGLLAQRLTSIPNSSRTFLGGIVPYTPELKTLFAGVPPALIEVHGAVSPEVATALAGGIRTLTGSSIGIGITGLAGPTPGSGLDEPKPIGLIYIAIASATVTEVKEVNLTGDRERIRWWATQHALELLRRHLL